MDTVVNKRTRKGTKQVPVRTCAVCRSQGAPDELIRWVRADDGTVVPDLSARTFGRGAWSHPRPECLKRLIPALQKSFKASVVTTTPEALLLLRSAAEHRIGHFLGALKRQRLAVFGVDSTTEAFHRGDVHLVLMAKDARAAANAGFVREALQDDLVRVWGTKESLGHVFGRAEIGVVGVTDRGLATRLFGAIAMALLVQEPESDGSLSGQEIDVLSEVE